MHTLPLSLAAARRLRPSPNTATGQEGTDARPAALFRDGGRAGAMLRSEIFMEALLLMTRPLRLARRAALLAAALLFALAANSTSAAQEQLPEPQPVPAGAVRVTLLQVNDVYQIAPVDRGA